MLQKMKLRGASIYLAGETLAGYLPEKECLFLKVSKGTSSTHIYSCA